MDTDSGISEDVFIAGLFPFILILTMISLVKLFQIQRLIKTEYNGEQEDEIEAKKYTTTSDYSLFTNAGFIISVLVLSMAVLTSAHIFFFVLFFLIAIVIDYLLNGSVLRLIKQGYPEQNIPERSNPDFPQSILDLADNGENT